MRAVSALKGLPVPVLIGLVLVVVVAAMMLAVAVVGFVIKAALLAAAVTGVAGLGYFGARKIGLL